MLLLNFAHPLTPMHLEQLAQTLKVSETLRVLDVPTQFDPQQPFVEQVRALVDGVGLAPQQWQTTPLLVNLPSLNFIAACLLAELHGRMGYFPPVLRLHPVKDALPPRFEVAEVINLQTVRDQARAQRT